MVNDIAQKQRTINNCLHTFSFTTSTLDNTDVAIKNGQSRKTGNIEYKGRWQTMQKHNTICAGHHYTQTNTNNVSKTIMTLIQTTRSKDESKMFDDIILTG